MRKDFLKYKKTIGIISILAIILIISLISYSKSGFKDLKKNDTESIFVDAGISDNTSKLQNENLENNNKTNNIKLKNKYIVVEIKGEVINPNVYELDEESIVKDLIDKAGGLTGNADLSNINRAKKLQNHELICINDINDKNNVAKNSTASNNGTSSEKINVNSATVDELKKLNGVGDAKAKKIIEYREQSGGFNSLDDMKNVDGIGEKMFEKIKDQIEV